ncbi:MAG TPA: hypothetical protein VGF06_05895 [Terriglobales bacterium]|jgi:hypothetical protein
MDSTYLFLCGVAWCQFGEDSAGRELLRGLGSADHKIRALARAFLSRAGDRSKALLGEAVARQEISPVQAALCAFEQHQILRWSAERPAWGLPAAA